MTFLGIDVGTSAVKAVVVDEAGSTVAEADAPLATDRPVPGWSEQWPDAWLAATRSALAAVARSAPEPWGRIKAIGLSGQMHGAVVLGPDDRPLRPAILWNDGRASAEARALNLGVHDLGRIAGVPAMAGFTAPKLLWLARHEPEIHARIAHLLLPKDYVRLALTGERVTDPCDAAGSLLLDEAKRTWHRPTVEAVGLDPSALPAILEGPEVSGRLTARAAAELGLPAGIPVATGAGDAAAGAIGIGAVDDGDSFISIGTSCQLFVTDAAYRPNPEALVHAFAHGIPDRWFSMAAMLNGASPLAWLAGVLGGGDVGALIAGVAAAGKAISPVTALPYLAGERTPLDDPDARGVLFGLDGSTTAADIAQAVMEALAFTLMDADRVLADAGVRAVDPSVVGGGARSRLWVEMIASALDRPVRLVAGAATGPANGAARLARLAVTGEPVESVCEKPSAVDIVQPDPARRDALARRYPEFRALYAALRDRFRLAAATSNQ
jgi:xylulokinase